MAGADIARAKEAMRRQIGHPILRQPNLRPQIVQAIAAPEQYPVDARARLAKMVQDKYGEQAQNILPYLGVAPEENF